MPAVAAGAAWRPKRRAALMPASPCAVSTKGEGASSILAAGCCLPEASGTHRLGRRWRQQ